MSPVHVAQNVLTTEYTGKCSTKEHKVWPKVRAFVEEKLSAKQQTLSGTYTLYMKCI